MNKILRKEDAEAYIKYFIDEYLPYNWTMPYHQTPEIAEFAFLMGYDLEKINAALLRMHAIKCDFNDWIKSYKYQLEQKDAINNAYNKLFNYEASIHIKNFFQDWKNKIKVE